MVQLGNLLLSFNAMDVVTLLNCRSWTVQIMIIRPSIVQLKLLQLSITSCAFNLGSYAAICYACSLAGSNL